MVTKDVFIHWIRTAPFLHQKSKLHFLSFVVFESFLGGDGGRRGFSC